MAGERIQDTQAVHTDEMKTTTSCTVRNASVITRMESTGWTDANGDDRFRLEGSKHTRQYAQLYFYRLSLVRARYARAQGCKEATRLRDARGGSCVVIATVYKEQKLKPDTLSAYTKGRMLSASETLGAQQHGSDALHRMLRSGKKFVEEKDIVIVEDDTARMKLVLTGEAADAAKKSDVLAALVTGVVVLLEGVAMDDGCFHAHTVDFVKPEPQQSIALNAVAHAETIGDPLVALVSGLDIGNSSQLRLQLLIDFLCGNSGGEADQLRSARVVRVLVAGGALSMTGNFRHAVSSRETRGDLKAWLREVDMTLSELASGVPVDVMPGEGEPTNHNLPQQPFHAMLLPGLVKYSTSARLTTNPHCVTERGVRFIGTSGQNVRDVYRYSSLEDGLDVLEHTLRWGNLAPTAPDTLPCYPVADKDVFALEEWPHVYFSGMMGEYGSRLVEGMDSSGGPCATRIVSVPDFSTTGQIAVVNLRTLECDAMMFDAIEMDA